MTAIYAHDWKILGDDRIPRWPSKIGEKRPIRVEINSYTTIGAIGAKHWYVNVEEHKNQWWSEERNAWVELSCDSGNKGYHLRASVLTIDEAIEVAKMFVVLIAGQRRRKHYVEWSGPGRPRWAERL